ncbi:lymphocyte-specific helicase-like [Nasonia vitripennis]|uniref:Uncharacterized protein n=1 Tax=Nasonia vitripennis TaxID=7425 RepID=A0A7M7G5G3_NASVI|nr:lymphocyte-specific helicase-like [Nasonia vitripennis]
MMKFEEIKAEVGMDLPLSEAAMTKGISRDVVDPSEDSGFDSISVGSNSSTEQIKKENEGTIGEGIQFVDPALIAAEAEEQRLRAEEKKRKTNEELVAKRKAEQEAYEQEIKEKQYKRLMHLLSKSKAMSNFIMSKFETKKPKEEAKEEPNKALKRKNTKEVEAPVPKKRGRKPNKKYIDGAAEENPEPKRGRKKMNLSQEDISEELASMSDDEPSEEKENDKPIENFVQSKYFRGELRDYQKEGVNWLKVLYENGLNGILADEMGLGKTVQIIALFSYLIEKQIAGPYMVVVPLSTLANWTTEFERFAPQLPVVVYYGYANQRSELRKKLQQKKRIGSLSTLPIVLTTYEMPQKDAAFLRNFNWRYIVIDEAQRIKNYNCLLFRILKSYNSFNRLLMTGTPLQNNLSELWSLLNFLLPDIFNSLDLFESWFDAKDVQNEEGKQKFLKQEQEKQVLSALREILQPFMLRRLKEDVCPDIPPLKEVMVYTPLTAIQYNLYSSILNRDIAKLQKVKPESTILDVNGVRPKRRCTQKHDLGEYHWRNNIGINDFAKKPEVATEMVGNKVVKAEDVNMWNKFTDVTEENVDYLVRLKLSGNDVTMYRHVVNHPYLIHYPLTDAGDYKVDENIIKASGKILVLDALLKKLYKNGHKVLLFSTMTMVLDVIEDYLSLRGFKYVRLDGAVAYDDRKDSIDSFQKNPEVFLFLLTTKAGAVGLNLAAADTVIIYDSDWNPQNDLQAMARCHRIGQTKPVAVYRLCTKGTVDEAIIKRANAKRFLEKAVISKETGLVNSEEGLSRLKKLFEEDSFKVANSKNEVYTDAELDELLDRSDMILSKKEEETK